MSEERKDGDRVCHAAREIVLQNIASRLQRDRLPSWLAEEVVAYGRECFRLGHLHAHEKPTLPSRTSGGFEEEKTPIRFLWSEDES